MLRVEEAQERILAASLPLGPETVLLPDALGRALHEPVRAERALPPWDNSAMDGYALQAADAATPGAALEVVGTIAAGHPATARLERGQAMRIMTGAPLPEGANAVVMRERTREEGGRVHLEIAVHPGDHVRGRGDDLGPGDTVLEPGDLVGPGEIGLCAALGRSTLSVHRRPVVAIVSTGDELVEIDQTPGPGQIVNSNAHAMAALVRNAGGLPILHPIVRDDPAALRARFAEALAADVVVSIGGVSVGEFDYVKEALAAAGLSLDFWKVAMQPGKPVAFGLAGRRLGFGLPGNPASAMVSFHLFVGPALRRLGGRRSGLLLPRVPCALGEGAKKDAGRRFYLRVRAVRDGAGLVARPLTRQGSGMLRSMVGVNALVELAEERTTFAAGEELPALLLEPV